VGFSPLWKRLTGGAVLAEASHSGDAVSAIAAPSTSSSECMKSSTVRDTRMPELAERTEESPGRLTRLRRDPDADISPPSWRKATPALLSLVFLVAVADVGGLLDVAAGPGNPKFTGDRFSPMTGDVTAASLPSRAGAAASSGGACAASAGDFCAASG
jgi:hypothetical protein